MSIDLEVESMNFIVSANTEPRLPDILKIGEKYSFRVLKKDYSEGTKPLMFNGEEIGKVRITKFRCFDDGYICGRFEILELKGKSEELKLR